MRHGFPSNRQHAEISLEAVEGIGPVPATAIAAAVSNGPLSKWKAIAAWLGLVPRQKWGGVLFSLHVAVIALTGSILVFRTERTRALLPKN
ncbi:hypothetical protein ACPOL_1409 [Acidisarcina polymorpha]|uniref:Transposase IS116/IS110/IS902 C-terminal domain-containing protein n=1 Tax=Acidisarcina polymorpha TaxID=2211140 RepID=A0A2Z5FW69_9BACT|nr:transposase [Acidisarcina polymorpha]AXC10757.1 hypothetical protein ACPOL_1409 [Acidisarcina polymorpha]